LSILNLVYGSKSTGRTFVVISVVKF
jgi:hypothetical protein